MNTTLQQTGEIYSVSQLNREVKYLLEGSFPSIWVEGEISNFAAPGSGHWYFSLKDSHAQVKCAMFKPHNRQLGFQVKDGMQVLIKARVSLYEGRGDFQLIVEFLEEAGEGKLRKAFEALKKRLSEAGLFDSAHKKPLPAIPRCIGIITSPTGAAIRDILHILKRRFPCVPVVIYPTLVQGDSAAPTIVQAIQLANSRKESDVLILARGGGSLEDLWPFNEEIVAHAIYKSEIPIVTGVGHEVDFTIADFVSDLRAPTPSAAAELTTPDKQELLNSLRQDNQQLVRLTKQQMQRLQENLTWMFKHLQQQHPKRRLRERAQQIDLLEMGLIRLQTKLFNDMKIKLQNLQTELFHLNPLHSIREIKHQLSLHSQFLNNYATQSLNQQQQTIAALAAKLDALSPLATLKRGFAIATCGKDNHILQSAKEISVGDKILVKLRDGSLDCIVEKVIAT